MNNITTLTLAISSAVEMSYELASAAYHAGDIDLQKHYYRVADRLNLVHADKNTTYHPDNH